MALGLPANLRPGYCTGATCRGRAAWQAEVVLGSALPALLWSRIALTTGAARA